MYADGGGTVIVGREIIPRRVAQERCFEMAITFGALKKKRDAKVEPRCTSQGHMRASECANIESWKMEPG